MKRILSALLCLLLMLPCLGCSNGEKSILFYYTRAEFLYGTQDAVIAQEVREAPGHEDDLDYLLNLYLEGPLNQNFISPYPEGTAFQGFTYSDATMYVTLSQEFAQLEGMDHTIAAACMAYTCFQLTAAEKVVIKCNSEKYGNRSITLTRESMVLFDDTTAPPSEGEKGN